MTFVHYRCVWKDNCKRDRYQWECRRTIFLCLLNRPYEANNRIWYCLLATRTVYTPTANTVLWKVCRCSIEDTPIYVLDTGSIKAKWNNDGTCCKTSWINHYNAIHTSEARSSKQWNCLISSWHKFEKFEISLKSENAIFSIRNIKWRQSSFLVIICLLSTMQPNQFLCRSQLSFSISYLHFGQSTARRFSLATNLFKCVHMAIWHSAEKSES